MLNLTNYVKSYKLCYLHVDLQVIQAFFFNFTFYIFVVPKVCVFHHDRVVHLVFINWKSYILILLVIQKN
jgi:hypothetical protein